MLLNCLHELFIIQYWRIFFSQLFMFTISFLIKNPTLVDVSWCLNHLIIALGIASNNFTDFSRFFTLPIFICLSLTTLWFFRLGGFIFYYRIWIRHVDPRYKELANKRKLNETVFSFIQFNLQGVLSTVTSIPLYYSLNDPMRSLNIINILSVGIACIGIIGEAIADNQLQAFKYSRKSSEGVLREGLFKRARHPNLFFDLVFWASIGAYGWSFETPSSSFTFLGPFLLWAIMYNLTIPVTRKHMLKTRPNYEKVIAETNVFIPI